MIVIVELKDEMIMGVGCKLDEKSVRKVVVIQVFEIFKVKYFYGFFNCICFSLMILWSDVEYFG